MRDQATHALIILALSVLVVCATARASDGVLEINQICATGDGCFPGDSAGFPVQISSAGSYRLTSSLTTTDENTTLIFITGAGARVDLNGFALIGPNSFSGPGGSCSTPGSGSGVRSSANDVSIANGRVRGMGSHGIDLGTASTGNRVERFAAIDNCGIGIRVPLNSLVSEGIARLNSSHGIVGNSGSRVVDSISGDNGGTGIRAEGSGDLTVDGCVANSNGENGIFGGSRSLVRGATVSQNAVHGVSTLNFSEVIETIANRNADRGITTTGTLGAGDVTAIGLDVGVLNGGLDYSGGSVIACNMRTGNLKSCP